MSTTEKNAPSPARAIGYVRCSTVEQSDSGFGLAAQHTAIEAEAKRRGWVLVDVLTDAGVSGKTLVGREALTTALAAVQAGQADVIIVAKLDRLCCSSLNFAALMDRSRREGWAIVALDLGVAVQRQRERCWRL